MINPIHDQFKWSTHSVATGSRLLLCTSAPLVLYCDRFDRGSRQVKREPVDLLMEDYDVSLFQRVGIHNYYTKDHIITCDRCISRKFYSFVRWIIWWQVTSDEDAWRPLIRYVITSICILWFLLWYFILRNVMEYMKLIILPAFLEGAVFLKRRKMPKGYLVIVICIWPGSCRWQPTNDEKMVSMFYFLNIINLVSFHAWSRLMTSFQ